MVIWARQNRSSAKTTAFQTGFVDGTQRVQRTSPHFLLRMFPKSYHTNIHMFHGKNLVRWPHLTTWKTGKCNLDSDGHMLSYNRSSGKGRKVWILVYVTKISPSKITLLFSGLLFLISKMKDYVDLKIFRAIFILNVLMIGKFTSTPSLQWCPFSIINECQNVTN